MKKTKKILSILLSCLMLMSLLSVGVFAAEGTQDNPINANDKWFGWGVDCFLLNTTLDPGDTDGVWYQLTADAAGILQLEHSTPSDQYSVNEDGEQIPVPNLEYQITATVNGREYLAYEDGIYNLPIATYPVAVGDVITIHVIAQNTARGGTVYLNAKIVAGDKDSTIKVKGAPSKLYVAAGATIYYQDDSLNADYATQYVTLSGNSVADVTLYAAGANSAGNIVKQATYTDSDGDNVIEGMLGGSQGSAGAPPVKPNWIITNNSSEDRCFTFAVVEEAHECAYDDEKDPDCNVCGALRDGDNPSDCVHAYQFECDGTCMLCGELTNPNAAHRMTYVEPTPATCIANGNIGYYTCDYCGGCWDNFEATGMPLNQMTIVIPSSGEHIYDHDFDEACNACGEIRFDMSVMPILGTSVSKDVNGLAVQVKANIGGIQVDGKTAIYDDAFVNEFKLVGMGALVSNNGTVPTMETVDNNRVLNIPAEYLIEFDAEHDAYYYAIRITDIPENQKDTAIIFHSYFIYEDHQGVQQVVYEDVWTSSYNEAAGL